MSRTHLFGLVSILSGGVFGPLGAQVTPRNDPEAIRRCDIAIEIVRTGDSPDFARTLTRYPERDKLPWAFSHIRSCGARGAAVLAAQMGAKKAVRDTAELRVLTDPTRNLLDGNIFQAAARIADDAAASQEARVFALRTLVWSLEPRLDLRFDGLVSGNGRCILGAALHISTWEGSPLPGNRRKRVEEVARRLSTSTAASVPVRNAAACALQEALRRQ